MSTPNVKFEHFEQSPAESLAESFTSNPGEQYPSLFSTRQSAEPFQAMTPQSYDEDHDESMYGDDMGDMGDLGDMGGSSTSTAPEKKPVKKRKSWGQQLPEPKTNLPPRKRAKTEDEKEQRRVERVLRNRRAAQSSRERKRKEVEALEAEKQQIERRNNDLELQLANLASKCADLEQRLEKATGVAHGNLPDTHIASTQNRQENFPGQSPIALTQVLFEREQDSARPMMSETHYPLQSAMTTVDPASLSPPPMESFDESSFDVSSFGMTQHSAAMLCDLQCQPKEQRTRTNSTLVSARIIAMTLWLQMSLTAISNILGPLAQIRASLMSSSSLLPTPPLMTLIIWLATTSASLTIPAGTISSTKTRSHSLRPRFTLRIRLLRRLLACSPNLARPLLDATLEAMRLPSKQQLARDCLNGAGVCDLRDGEESSSFESLITLSWAIKVIMKEQARAQAQAISKPDAVMDVGQSCEQLKELFGSREMSGVGRKVIMNLASPPVNGGILGQKSLDGQWSMALEDEPSS